MDEWPDPTTDAGGGTATGFTPGWYPDQTGFLRWWDGEQWGPYLPPPPSPRSNTTAVVAHIGGIVGGFIAPLIVYLTTDRNDRFTRHHGATALNWQLSVMAVSVVGIVVAFPIMFLSIGTAGSGTNAAMPAGFLGFIAVWVILMALNIANVVLSIIGMIKASKGEWWHYPVRIRFVKEEPPV